ncbi:hypothetical protein V8D89_005273 [Ganoderma adspersum]
MDPIPTTSSLTDVQDILYYIFPRLDTERSSWDDIFRVRQTLLHSALTCRTFAWPALSALWRSLPSEKPLTSLLFALGIAQDSRLTRDPPLGLDSPYVTMEDPLTHPNWSRFCEYAMRVRKINLDPSTDLFGQKMSFWNEVGQFMHDEPILPLLRSVSITGNDVRTVLRTTPLVLISPSVREMSFWLEGDGERREEPEQEQVLSAACTRAPRLETITLAISPWRIDLSTLHANPHLRSVSIHAQLTIGSLAPLTHLAELRHLSVIVSEGGAPTSTLPFPSLRRLSVRGVWDAIRGLLEHVQAPHTHSLTLHVSHADPTQLIPSSRACLQVAATAFPALETLLAHSTRTTRNPIWDFPTALDTEGALMAAVEPLLALRRLRHLTLDLQLFIFRVTSDDVRRFAEAWPDAEELLIDSATADGGRAGFESVLHFARRCPCLRALRLPAMDLAVGAFEGLEYPNEPHVLRDLDVKEVVFPREADLSGEMTAFIQRVFPNTAVPFTQHLIVVTDEESGDRSRLV